MRIDFEDLKMRIPIDALLEHLSADVPHLSRWSGWQPMRCPFHDDSQASASVNLNEGRFRCHACDVGGDIVDLAKEELGTADTVAAVEWLEENLGDG